MSEISRVIIGLNDEEETVIQASPPGEDVLEITDEGAFTFNSNWPRTGIVHEVGFFSGFQEPFGSSTTTWQNVIAFNPLPYRPHVRFGRVSDTGVVWDELTHIPASQLLYTPYRLANVTESSLTMIGEPLRIVSPLDFIYVVFKAPVPGLPPS